MGPTASPRSATATLGYRSDIAQNIYDDESFFRRYLTLPRSVMERMVLRSGPDCVRCYRPSTVRASSTSAAGSVPSVDGQRTGRCVGARRSTSRSGALAGGWKRSAQLFYTCSATGIRVLPLARHRRCAVEPRRHVSLGLLRDRAATGRERPIGTPGRGRSYSRRRRGRDTSQRHAEFSAGRRSFVHARRASSYLHPAPLHLGGATWGCVVRRSGRALSDEGTLSLEVAGGPGRLVVCRSCGRFRDGPGPEGQEDGRRTCWRCVTNASAIAKRRWRAGLDARAASGDEHAKVSLAGQKESRKLSDARYNAARRIRRAAERQGES